MRNTDWRILINLLIPIIKCQSAISKIYTFCKIFPHCDLSYILRNTSFPAASDKKECPDSFINRIDSSTSALRMLWDQTLILYIPTSSLYLSLFLFFLTLKRDWKQLWVVEHWCFLCFSNTLLLVLAQIDLVLIRKKYLV